MYCEVCGASSDIWPPLPFVVVILMLKSKNSLLLTYTHIYTQLYADLLTPGVNRSLGQFAPFNDGISSILKRRFMAFCGIESLARCRPPR